MSVNNRKGITVRFEDEEMEKLEELAKRYHVSSATIIRWSLKALADYVEVSGGRITLPLDFSRFYEQAVRYPVELKQVADKSNEGNELHRSTPAPGARKVKYPQGRKRKA